MYEYRVVFKHSADRDLKRLPTATQVRIVREIDLLVTNPRPHGVVKLAGYRGVWRLRVGDFRVIYEIHDARITILVLRIGHRRDVYRDM